MQKYTRYFLLLVAVISLTGCATLFGKNGIIKKRQEAYLTSQDVPPLQMPAGISGANIKADYNVPKLTNQSVTPPISLLPPDSLTDKVARGEVPVSVLKQKSK